jgi:hypothetical protein
MLGELIYQGSGKRIVRRVVSSEPVKVEVTFEGGGKVLGVEAMEIGTYTSVIRPDGTIYGEGVGTFKERGAVGYRGAVYYHTASPKLSRLNTVAGVFEFEADESGNVQSKIWEWK